MATKKQTTCTRKRAVDYERFYPTRDGHIVDTERPDDYEQNEIDAGATLYYGSCAVCGKAIHFHMANDEETGRRHSDYFPEREMWERLNRT